MRFTFALGGLLASLACSRGEPSKPPAQQTTAAQASAANPAEPDALMLRVPRRGGLARVVAYPAIDSTEWSSNDSIPPLDRVLGFDVDGGLVAAVNVRNQPLWIDLRMGTVVVPTRNAVTNLVSQNGSTIFGVGSDGAVVRFTLSGNWVFKPRESARAVFPQPNGAVVALTGRGAFATLVRVRPPDVVVLDSVLVPNARAGAGAPLSDRVYLTVDDRSLLPVRVRTFSPSGRITLDHRVTNIAATPSGDRFYVITDSSKTLSVIDRYQDRVTVQIGLSGKPRDLRVDPLGRFVLVRPSSGDSAWVVSVGTDKVVGTVKTAWRSDFPLVAPDGAIGVVDGTDVAFVDASSGREQRRAAGGALDFWYAFSWAGFRSHPIPQTPTRVATDSDSTRRQPVVAADSTKARPTPVDSTTLGFTLSFAALLNEAKAREQAAKIVVDGQTARVVATTTDGIPVFRVVLGPFRTREEADRAGRASGLSYFVYAGLP